MWELDSNTPRNLVVLTFVSLCFLLVFFQWHGKEVVNEVWGGEEYLLMQLICVDRLVHLKALGVAEILF